MSRLWKSVPFIILLLLFPSITLAGPQGETLFQKAQKFEKQTEYTKATELYKRARDVFLKQGKKKKADLCRTCFQRIAVIIKDYPFSAVEAEKALRQELKDVPEKRIKAWLKHPKVARLKINGKPFYFYGLVKNFLFRNMDIARHNEEMTTHMREYYEVIKNLLEKKPLIKSHKESVHPYTDPVVYRGQWTIEVKRNKLPKKGMLKIWIPLPVLTGPQTDVGSITITPEEYVKLPARLDTGLGLAYLEVPLHELAQDLSIKTVFLFKHYEQRFVIDPRRTGAYDKKSALYKTYTASRGNTFISKGIRAAARRVAGAEKNPYLAARKIYDHVVKEVQYSFVPHYSLNARKYPESVYVHKYRYGDCGAQSLYFSALCRSLGIPSRTTGGYQMLLGKAGSHFWAEFYLPNYGWIPVDTSVAQVADYVPELSDQQRQEYRDYFFGNMDPSRLVIQKDIDLPLVPTAAGVLLLPMAFQDAAAICDTSDELPGLLVSDGWKWEVKPLVR